MKVGQLLAKCGSAVIKVLPEESLADVALKFSETEVGRKYSIAVVVDGDDRVVGVLTLGDIAAAFGTLREAAVAMPLSKAMTSEVIVAKLEDTLEEALKVMADKEIRHMPVVEDGRCQGLVSRRDAMEALHSDAVRQLKYVTEFVFRSGSRY